MPTIYIDNKPYEVKDGQNLLQAGLSLGLDIPYFCWHPALGSVGACRQCAVKQFRNEEDDKGMIVMSCMVPVTDKARISVADKDAVEFRKSVIEWLMTNHPHDCPVCDEGGECHLQDMTVMTGHDYRRFRFRKRTFVNQYLGPFINHEMNRCIQCYRCVRFYDDYAGGDDLQAFASHNHVYFGRHEDGALENEFSGNLVEVCPTGVFTDKTLKLHYTRKWDLTSAPSVCTHCAVGCNTLAGERYGSLRRILNRYNSQVNGYFLCDRGRFGYDFVNSDRRIRTAGLRGGDEGGARRALSRESLKNTIGPCLVKDRRVAGIGSPRASMEANYALRKLVGEDRFYSGMAAAEDILVREVVETYKNSPARNPSLSDIEKSDATLVLGEDLTNTAPRMALSLRQAVRNKPLEAVDALRIPRWHDKAAREIIQDARGPLILASTGNTRLDDAASETVRGAPDDLARLGFAVAHAIDEEAPAVPGLSAESEAAAKRAAESLLAAKIPLVVSGVTLGNAGLIRAAANVANALCRKGKPALLSYVLPEVNTLGLGLMAGRPLEELFASAEQGEVDSIIVLENDLYRRAPSARVDRLFEQVGDLCLTLDSIETGTTAKANVVLPVGSFAESDGTFISSEGRAQRFFQAFPPNEQVRESWRWLQEAGEMAGRFELERWSNLDDVIRALVEDMPELQGIGEAAPGADYRVVGQKMLRSPRRYSGRTAMLANVEVSEPKPPEDPDSPLSFTMEGYAGLPHPALTTHYWAAGWNSVQSLHKFQDEIGGPLKGGDPGVRLLEPVPDARFAYREEIPSAFERERDQLTVVPAPILFGSEELSALAPAIAERSQGPFIQVNSEDAGHRQLEEGDLATLEIGGGSYCLPVRIDSGLPAGIAGLTTGIAGLEDVVLPARGALKKKKET